MVHVWVIIQQLCFPSPLYIINLAMFWMTGENGLILCTKCCIRCTKETTSLFLWVSESLVPAVISNQKIYQWHSMCCFSIWVKSKAIKCGFWFEAERVSLKVWLSRAIRIVYCVWFFWLCFRVLLFVEVDFFPSFSLLHHLSFFNVVRTVCSF